MQYLFSVVFVLTYEFVSHYVYSNPANIRVVAGLHDVTSNTGVTSNVVSYTMVR